MTEQEQVQVSQTDRDAAEAYWHGWSNNVPEHDGEFHPLVLLLARHRIEATAEALELLKRARDREHNPYEPWNQTKLYHDLTAAIARIEGEQP
jgi:hypothetical protein